MKAKMDFNYQQR